MDVALKTRVWIQSHKELKLPSINFDIHAYISFN